MSAASEGVWWVAATEGLRGPLTQGEIFDSVRLGSVQQNTLLRSGGDGDWVTAGVAFPGAFGSAGPNNFGGSPPIFSSPAAPITQPPAALGAPVDVGVSVLLSCVTFSIWWNIWVYQRLTWSAETSGRPMGNRVTYFWLNIGLLGGGLFLSLLSGGLLLLLAIPALIASVVFWCLLVNEFGKDQELTLARSSMALPASPAMLIALLAVGNGLGFTIILLPVAIVVLVFFYLYFFRNHNAVAAALNASS